ncbi:unnamed protein product [Caenorhabditis auriculariae]|uniref:Uncharacterized protein n=1 Tax=Caenorhabditis auriculariae TaxID=2777116 RepID=A0A8S1HB98_9PELO|nr:unnamed protein product [Caenorhabditis auriculariae]
MFISAALFISEVLRDDQFIAKKEVEEAYDQVPDCLWSEKVYVVNMKNPYVTAVVVAVTTVCLLVIVFATAAATFVFATFQTNVYKMSQRTLKHHKSLVYSLIGMVSVHVLVGLLPVLLGTVTFRWDLGYRRFTELLKLIRGEPQLVPACCFVAETNFCAGVTPVVMLPLTTFYPCGWLRFLGIPTLFQIYIMLTLFSLALCTTIHLYIYRLVAVLPNGQNSTNKNKSINRMIPGFIFTIGDLDGCAPANLMDPNLYIINLEDPRIQLAVSIPVFLLAISGSCCFILTITSSILLKQHSRQFSSQTNKMQRSFILSLGLQVYGSCVPPLLMEDYVYVLNTRDSGVVILSFTLFSTTGMVILTCFGLTIACFIILRGYTSHLSAKTVKMHRTLIVSLSLQAFSYSLISGIPAAIIGGHYALFASEYVKKKVIITAVMMSTIHLFVYRVLAVLPLGHFLIPKTKLALLAIPASIYTFGVGPIGILAAVVLNTDQKEYGKCIPSIFWEDYVYVLNTKDPGIEFLSVFHCSISVLIAVACIGLTLTCFLLLKQFTQHLSAQTIKMHRALILSLSLQVSF